MIKLKPRESAVLGYIWAYWEQWKNSPLEAEIAEYCHFSPSSINYLLNHLDQKGYIQWVHVRHRRIITPLYKE